MKSTIKTLGLLILMFLLSFNMRAQVKSDYDKNIDFSTIKTYTFGGWANDSDKILTPFDKKRITDAMVNELSARGMTYTQENGQVVITLFIVVNQKTSTSAYTTYNGNMGYRGRWGWGYGGMGSATTTYNEDDYLEGTFVVDMYDTTSKDLIWQGVITSVVTEKPEKREKTIPKKIKKLMKEYPVKPIK